MVEVLFLQSNENGNFLLHDFLKLLLKKSNYVRPFGKN